MISHSGNWPRLGAGWELREACPTDNADILEFLASKSMQAGVDIRFDRRPDFFALPRLRAGQHESWLAREHGRIRALGSVHVTPAYLHGRVEPVAYLSDLRVEFSRQLAGHWRDVLTSRIDALGARYGYCSVLRNNRFSKHLLRGRGKTGGGVFSYLKGYSNVSVLARKPWISRANPSVQVTTAGSTDQEALRIFLDRQSSHQLFGAVFDEASWKQRLRAWPGLNLGSFFLVREDGGELIGCLAPWDSRPVRGTVIEKLSPALGAVRRLFNLAARCMRVPLIPPPGTEALSEIHLSHVALRARDPTVFSALLNAAFDACVRSRRYSMVTLCLYDDDPLWEVLDDYWYVSVPLDLYAYRSDSSLPCLSVPPREPTGFEIYLV